MSSYINFYIKNHSNNSYTPLQSFSRSSAIYKIANDCNIKGILSTGEALPASIEVLNECISEALEMQKDLEESIKREKDLKQDILQCNNSLEEKREALAEIQVNCKELEDELEEVNYGLYFFRFLYKLADDAPYSYDDHIYDKEVKNTTIYGGIDTVAPDCISARLEKEKSAVKDLQE